MTPKHAREIAEEAFGLIAGDPDLASAFLHATGSDAAGLRALAGRPGFALSVLDFVAETDERVLRIAAELSIRPADLLAARAALDPAARGEFA